MRATTTPWASSSSPMRLFGRLPRPDATLLDFLQTTYEAAAVHARWDRKALER